MKSFEFHDHPDKEYLSLLRLILDEGVVKTDRTGTGTKGVIGAQMRFDLQKGFPLLTTKKVNFNAIVHELLWFLKGSTNIEYLVQNNVHIWSEWPYKAYLQKNALPVPPSSSEEWTSGLKAFEARIATDADFAREHGELGPVYGSQWRKWSTPEGYVDQIADAIQQIRTKPDSRRIIVSAWNAAQIDEIVRIGGLPPCHCLFQFFVADGALSCQLYQRSCDTFLGVPFNVASYALLLSMVAQVTGLRPGTFVWTGGDVHLYQNHLVQAAEQLGREPRAVPTLRLNPAVKEIDDFTFEDIAVENYEPHAVIRAPIAV